MSETTACLLGPFDISSRCAMENRGYTWIYNCSPLQQIRKYAMLGLLERQNSVKKCLPRNQESSS